MRRIVVTNIVSLDGYFEGPDNGALDLNMDGFFDRHNLECFEAADAALVGATSYQGFSGYWPGVEHHPEVAPGDPMARAFDETNRGISRNWNAKPIFVVSDSHQVPADSPWASHSTVIGRSDVADWKNAGDGTAVVFGSHILWNRLMARGLVDELRLMVGPSALGGGTRAFEAPAALTLMETRNADDSDNVLLVYAPA